MKAMKLNTYANKFLAPSSRLMTLQSAEVPKKKTKTRKGISLPHPGFEPRTKCLSGRGANHYTNWNLIEMLLKHWIFKSQKSVDPSDTSL